MPVASNCDSDIAWSRVSKAFYKSTNIPAKFILAVNGVSNFVDKINQSMGSRVVTPKNVTTDVKCNINAKCNNFWREM